MTPTLRPCLECNGTGVYRDAMDNLRWCQCQTGTMVREVWERELPAETREKLADLKRQIDENMKLVSIPGIDVWAAKQKPGKS